MAMRSRDSDNKQDGSDHSRSRNKENQPTKLSRPTLVKTPGKQDFFTDSYIDADSTSSSLIPTPQRSTNAVHLNARRQVRVKHSPQHRQTRSELPALPRNPRFPKPLARGTSPIRSNGLTTPPRSRHGSFAESPVDVLSSPPPALVANYHRIDQEEDLAATEGEISDPEVEAPEAISRENLQRLPRSAATTPTADRSPVNLRHRRNDDTSHSVLSDPTGTSFVRQYSDPNLRAIMTPHFEETAKDREALDRVWQSQKPIAFSKAGRILLEADEVAQSVSSSPRVQPERIVAFSKAGRIKLASDDLFRKAHQRTFSDITDRVERNVGQHHDDWHNDEFRREAMPPNPRVHREPYFPQVHGFPARDSSQRPIVETNFDAALRRARSESPYVHRSPPVREPPGMVSNPQQSCKDTTGTSNASVQTSDIWTRQAADEPVPSIEKHTQRRLSDTQQLHTSPDFSRKFNFDFTGQSFQVSDSPPVRAKNILQDYQRDREIRGIAKQAVTTSRLNQLRERESQERLRQTSRSPVSETDQSEGHANDSPRLSSIGLQRTISSGSEVIRATPDRSSSHEILQRLARGSSTTPRTMTPSDRAINGAVIGPDSRGRGRTEDDNSASSKLPDEKPRDVEATPKVTGAWTDTILPNTVKTAKRDPMPLYVQTPHINAGGWVNTPAPSGPNRLEPLAEQTEEIPEGLTDGIAKDNASKSTIMPGNQEPLLPSIQGVLVGESLTRKVLKDAKANPTESNDDNDSLALGNTTIKSLEGFLDMGDTNLTNISRLGDTELLGKLGSKLQGIVKTIHEAQNGISKIQDQLEPQSDPEVLTPTTPARGSSLFPLGLLTISIPVPVLFRARNANQWLPRPTPLGWILMLIWLWYVIECAMAELYSHPIYADKYTWPEEPEPDFPFALPTMLWRWSRLDFVRPLLIEPAKALFVGFLRMVSMVLGFTDGYAQEQLPVNVQQPEITQAEGYGFGMTNDEFL